MDLYRSSGSSRPAPPADLKAGFCDAIVFDASPWGGGAILFQGRRPMEWMAAEWTEDLCRRLRVERGQSAFLSFFEALTALAAVALWCPVGGRSAVALVGDNVAALTVAVSRRGRWGFGAALPRACLGTGTTLPDHRSGPCSHPAEYMGRRPVTPAST